MKTYLLPEKVKSKLRRIWGIPIFIKKAKVRKKSKKI